MPLLSAQDLCRRAEELKGEKSSWENLAQVCAKYCLPAKAQITQSKTEGERLSSEIYNSTPIEAAQVAAAGFQNYLASGRFFALEFADPELNEDTEASDWLYEEQEGIYDVLNNSNFDEKIGEFFKDLVVLPGATQYSESDPEDIIRFENIPFEEVYIGINPRGKVDELHRIFEYTVRQAFMRWPKTCGAQITDLYRKGKWQQKFKFLHSVGPRHERVIGKKGVLDMPFYSCYVLMTDKDKRKVEEKGYETFPYNVGRWAVTTGQTWAYTPASVGIADILMLNNMDMTVLMSGQQAVAPSWLFPHEDYVAPLNLNQNFLNFAIPQNLPGGGSRDWKPMPMVSGANMPIGLELLQDRENRIKRYFFNDLFLPLLEKQATAYEVAKTIEKRMGILGGVTGGITKNNLGPAINRTRIIRRAHPLMQKILRPVPKQVQEQDVKINYISPLVIAQKAAQEQNLEAFLAAVAQMMAVNPQVRFKVKWDKSVDKMAKNRSIDPDVLTSDQEFADLVAADNEAQQKAQALALAAAGGQAAESIGKGREALNPEKGKKAKK